MLNVLFRSLILVIPAFLMVTLMAFLLVHVVPGDPVIAMLGDRPMTAEQHAEALARLGLDRPLWVQYADYLGSLLRLDFGQSYITRETTIDAFLKRLPATLELSLASLFLALILGLPAGVIAAVKRGTIWDWSTMTLSLVGFSMPVFWWGLLLILGFSVGLGWTPVSGRIGAEFFVERRTGFMLIDAWLSAEAGAVASAARHLVLPTVTLSLGSLAIVARMTRAAMIEVLDEDYIRTARAKGIAPWRVVNIHALRNGVGPVVTVIGLQLGYLLGGAILTETIFAWPGIGKWLIDAIYRRDYPVIQAAILFIATMTMLVNLTVDLIQAALDPRIRQKRA